MNWNNDYSRVSDGPASQTQGTDLIFDNLSVDEKQKTQTPTQSTTAKLKQIQSVTIRTDDDEEVQAMHALIQRWTVNGWSVKNISQFSRSESYFGGLGMQASSYSTIIFEKEETVHCPICNINVNNMNIHREWHRKRETQTENPKLP